MRLNTIGTHTGYQVFGTFSAVPTSFWRGSLTLVAAPPGVGKTSWALDMVADAAAQGIPAAIGCYEHTEQELAQRLRQQAAGKIFGPHPEDPNDIYDPAVERLLARAGNAVLLHLSSATDTLRTYEDMLLHDEGFPADGPALVVLDYIQRAPVVNRMGQLITDDTRAGEAAAALKRMALEHGWGVVGISAMEKTSFTPSDLELLRTNPEQTLATLLGDERLVYEADRVFVLYRLETLPCGCCYRWARLTAKNRLGRTGVDEVLFWGQRTLAVQDTRQPASKDTADEFEGVQRW